MVATFALLVLLGLAVLAALGLVGIVLLLASRKTRTAGIILLACLAVLILVPMVLAALWIPLRVERSTDMVEYRSEVRTLPPQMRWSPPDVVEWATLETPPVELPAEPPAILPEDSPQPEDDLGDAAEEADALPIPVADDVVAPEADTLVAEKADASVAADAGALPQDLPEPPLSADASLEADLPQHGAAAARDAPADEPPPAADTAAPLSRAPPSPPRPEWVDAPLAREGSVDRIAVCGGPFVTRGEARRGLEQQLQQEVADYVAAHLPSPRGASLVHFDLRFIRDHLVREEFAEQVEYSVGPMYQHHALLVLDEAFRREIEQRWQQAVLGRRLVFAATALGLVLAGLAALLTYFRLDTATRGYYTGRLQFAAAAAILALAACGVLAARWLP